MLDGAEAAFRLGETSLTDLLETHRSAAEAELAVLELHQAALAAHRDLERLAGPESLEPTPEPHDSIESPSQED
jgi:outer membrane protein TolC